jgi:hypothetical protein
MLFLENTPLALFIFNGLQSHHCQRALLGYHYLLISPLTEKDFPDSPGFSGKIPSRRYG